MKYTSESIHSIELFNGNSEITNEDLVKENICKIIKEIPLSELKKIFNINVYDYREYLDGWELNVSSIEDDYTRRLIYHLFETKLIKIAVNLDLD